MLISGEIDDVSYGKILWLESYRQNLGGCDDASAI
jgi:hypothetical protein